MSQDCAADLTIKLSDMHMVDYLMIYSITDSFPACIKLLDVKLCTHPLSVLLADICQSVISLSLKFIKKTVTHVDKNLADKFI